MCGILYIYIGIGNCADEVTVGSSSDNKCGPPDFQAQVTSWTQLLSLYLYGHEVRQPLK